MQPASYTYTLSEAQGKRLREVLEEEDFEFREVPYAHFGATKGKCSVSYYQSGKTVIQGKEARHFIEFNFEPRVLEQALLGYEEVHQAEMFQPHFGVDESGKGDFFGPLVVAGVYTDAELTREWMSLGVRDSKSITSDKKARDLADTLRKHPRALFEVVVMMPQRYNELYHKMRNLNTMLAWAHGKVIENLHAKRKDCPRALSDQFAHPRLIKRELQSKKINIQLQQRTKAESDIAVAAASIIARAVFLEKLEQLGKSLDITLPKGASSKVKDVGGEILKTHGYAKLQEVSKMHFKTYAEILLAGGIQLA